MGGMGSGMGGMGGMGGMMGGMFGGLGAAQAALEEVKVDSSKNEHVDEITVDDFFNVLIGALDNDKDVFDSEAEMTSDPWFGKQLFGGHPSGINFIDPWRFIDQIYGSPFGMSGSFGGPQMPGYGPPSYGPPGYGPPSYGYAQSPAPYPAQSPAPYPSACPQTPAQYP